MKSLTCTPQGDRKPGCLKLWNRHGKRETRRGASYFLDDEEREERLACEEWDPDEEE